MPRERISSEELWRRVEETRLRDQKLREPFLIAFRATQEEIDIRAAESSEDAGCVRSEFHQFAEQLARLGREGVRFERYLRKQGFYEGLPKQGSKDLG